MKLLTLAAGFATGYVLGSRAGREAYEQIVTQVRQVRANPTVVKAQEKAADAVAAKVHEAAPKAAAPKTAAPKTAAPKPQPPRRPATAAGPQ